MKKMCYYMLVSVLLPIISGASVVETVTRSPCCRNLQLPYLFCSKILNQPESWRCSCTGSKRNFTGITMENAVNMDFRDVLVTDVGSCLTHAGTIGMSSDDQRAPVVFSKLRMLQMTGPQHLEPQLALAPFAESPTFPIAQLLFVVRMGVRSIDPNFFDVFSGNLKTIVLNNNNLTVVSRDTFRSNLTNLQELSLASNQISEINGFAFEVMTDLRLLDLSWNKISSIEPRTFSKLGRLRSLKLAGNQLQRADVISFEGLYSLNKLQLDYNNINHVDFSKIPTCSETKPAQTNSTEEPCKPASFQLMKLKSVTISNNALNSTSSLLLSAVKGSLSELDFSFNRIDHFSLDHFANLCKLKVLNASYNRVTAVQRSLNISDERCRKLAISFAGNQIANLSASNFRSDRRISTLDLSKNLLTEVHGASFEGMTRLTNLDLNNNLITLFDPSTTSGLQTLNLEGNSLTTVSTTWLFSVSGNRRGRIMLGGNQIKCDKNLARFFEFTMCNEVQEAQLYSAAAVAELTSLDEVFSGITNLSLPAPGICTVLGAGVCKPRLTTSMNKCLLRAYLDLAADSTAAENVNIFNKLLAELEQLYVYAQTYTGNRDSAKLERARIQLVQALEMIATNVRIGVGSRLTGRVSNDILVGLLEFNYRRTRMPPIELGFHVSTNGVGAFLSDNGIPATTKRTRNGHADGYCSGQNSLHEVEEKYSEMNIALPMTVYHRISSLSQRIAFVAYKDKFLFPSNETVLSSVISADLPQVNTDDLKDPIVITANVKLSTNISRESIRCSFWNFSTSSWRNEGCIVANITTNTGDHFDASVTCHCNHLTNFAVLINHDTRENPVIEDDTLTELVSYTGIIASILGLSLTIIYRLCRREYRRGVPQLILLHLCSCLLVLYILMLMYDKPFIVKYKGTCFLVGFLMQYFLLSSWGWCVAEGVSMYLLLVQVFNVSTRRFLTKATISCYGGAVVMVAGSLILSGSTADTSTHPGYLVLDAYRYADACVVTYPNSLYFVILPISIACFVNIVCFFFVIRGLRQTATSDAMGGKKKNMVKKRLRQAVCVTTLLGITWCIGFIKIGLQSAYGPTSDVVWLFELIFSAVNSVQGFVLFLMFCATNLWKEYRCSREIDKKRGRLYSQSTTKFGSTGDKITAVTTTTHPSFSN